jgi:hypothetical protein
VRIVHIAELLDEQMRSSGSLTIIDQHAAVSRVSHER